MRVLAESTVETTATPEAVWAVWADAALRPQWHPRLTWARLEGPLAVGTPGQWQPDRGSRPVDVVVAVAEPGRRLVLDGTHGPKVARGHYEHEVAPRAGGGATITHRMALSGPLAAPIGAVLGRMLGVSASPEAVRAVARLAEARAGGPAG
jgi:uncharacterized protein YndB with AHSA1/START domain